MLGVFGALALVLAAVGVYGVISYDVGQRTREIGVRMALGARAGDVASLVMRDGLRVVAIGGVIGAGVALACGHVLRPLLYETSPRDPVVLVGVALLLSSWPRWRASCRRAARCASTSTSPFARSSGRGGGYVGSVGVAGL